MRRRDLIQATLILGVVRPLAARAQSAIPVVGFMSGRSPNDSAYLIAAFWQGLADAGFIEGQNVVVQARWAEGDYDRLPALAADLVARKAAVLIGVGGDVSAVVASKATTTIPVVFGMGADPVKAGLVASFNRPGGNVTGFTLRTSEMESKRLDLLRDLAPGVAVIGIIVNTRFPPAVEQLEDLRRAANVNQGLLEVSANDEAELDRALATLVGRHANAFLVSASPFFDTRRSHRPVRG